MQNHYIKDPIYNEINLGNQEWVLKLVNAPEFKRLQNIYQLGISFKVFPSATNTRYLHSLGVFQAAQKFILKLKEKYPNLIDDQKIKLVTAAALLHDIGHGPFSHVFEKISNIHHEDITIMMITNPKSNIYKILVDENINPTELEQIYKGEHKEKWINKLISSNLDVDRIDYMLRDAYFLGTHYSTIDIDFLAERTFIYNDDLVFSTKAKNVIESFLLGRYYMHDDIYDNKNSYTFEWSLINIFRRLKELKKEFQNKKELIYYYDLYNWIVLGQKPKLEYLVKLNDINFVAFLESLLVLNDEILSTFINHFLFSEENIYVDNYNEQNYLEILKVANNAKINKKYLLCKTTKNSKEFYSTKNDDLIILLDEKNKKTTPFPYKVLRNYYYGNIKYKDKNTTYLLLLNKKLLVVK